MAKPGADLAANHRIFVKEYLIDFNGTRAAVAAGFAESGAAVEANRLLRNAKVQELLAAEMRARESRLEKSGDDVVRELIKVAFADMAEFAEWGPDRVSLKESLLIGEATSAVKAVSWGKTGVNLTFHDKIKALELLSRHFNVCIPKKVLEHQGQIGLPPEINELVKLTPEDRKARLDELRKKQAKGDQ